MLKHEAYDRKLVRDFCDMHVTPAIFCCDSEQSMKRHLADKDAADKRFKEIMADPDKVKEVVEMYLHYLNHGARPTMWAR